MAVSIVLCTVILAWYATRGASVAIHLVVAGIGAFLVTYDALRIAGARRALAEPTRLAAFARGQVRSHRVRARIFLVGAPVVVLVTWVGLQIQSHVSVDAWAVAAAGTLFLAVAWVRWMRAVRSTG